MASGLNVGKYIHTYIQKNIYSRLTVKNCYSDGYISVRQCYNTAHLSYVAE